MRYENLLEAVPDALVGMDQKGIIRFVNRQTESLFGYDRYQLIGHPIDTLVPEPLWQIYAEHRQDYFADPSTRSTGLEVELNGRQQDGTELPINIRLSSIDTGDVLLVITALGDVNQRKRAVKSAQHTEAMVEYSDDAIIGLTPDGTITSWNPAAEQMYGYSAKEIIGRSGDLLTPEDRTGELSAILAKIKVGHYVEHAETTLVGKDGTAVPVSVAAAPIRAEDGEIVGVSSVHRDVTKRRQAFENAQRMAAIVECSQDAIVGGLLDGTITSWNPAAERMYGYSAEEMIGKPDTLITSKDQGVEFKTVLQRIRAGQHVKNLETKRVRKDGAVFPVSLTVSPIRDDAGAIIGTSVIYRDLTEQKGALAVAERMAAIVECSEDAIISRTLDGIIRTWNPAAARLFGYSSEEIVGKSIGLLVPQDRASEIITMLAEISAGRAVCDFETTRLRKDGTLFPASLTVSPIRNDSGVVVGASVIYRDVTRLKHAAQYARSLIEASLDPLETISPEGKITDVNEAAVKASGVPRNKLIGSDFSGYFTEPDKARQGYEQVFRQGLVTNYPLTLRHQDGTLTDISCNASLYRDAGGNVLGVLAAARDMTQQKEAVEAAQHMETIIEYSDEAIISSTLDGIITSWNKAAEKLYGYSSEEIVGKSIQPVAPPDRPEEIKDILTKIRAGQRVEHYETNRVRKDGTVFPVSLTASPIRDLNGTIVGTTVISHEMTDQS
jgi:PAS domain S-box-containing protein